MKININRHWEIQFSAYTAQCKIELSFDPILIALIIIIIWKLRDRFFLFASLA